MLTMSDECREVVCMARNQTNQGLTSHSFLWFRYATEERLFLFRHLFVASKTVSTTLRSRNVSATLSADIWTPRYVFDDGLDTLTLYAELFWIVH